jgi:hypothetical protein
MNWSFSDDRKFQACQRQWYFAKVVAHHSANDPKRKQAYLLSKLQGLNLWRGSLLDYVISEKVVKGIAGRQLPSLDSTLSFARTTFDAQVTFAREHRVHEFGLVPSKHPGVFAAWHDVEYGEGISDGDLEICWQEVSQCLENLYAMPDVVVALTSAFRSIPQRQLTFSLHDISVRATPDVILFRRQQAPVILDWKVYRNDSRDHRLQLACYALALTHCEPHRDFPQGLSRIQPTDIELVEVQLLTKKVRVFRLSDEDCSETEDFIMRSAHTIAQALDALPRKIIDPARFPAAVSPSICAFCQFKQLCWEDSCR